MPQHKGAKKVGGRLKGTPNKATVLKRQAEAKAIEALDITAERTMLEIARVGFANRTAIFDNGKLLPLEQWPADAQALLEGYEVVVKNVTAGDGHQDVVHKVQLAKKLGALEILAKHFGLAQDKVVHSGTIVVKRPW